MNEFIVGVNSLIQLTEINEITETSTHGSNLSWNELEVEEEMIITPQTWAA